MFDLSKYDFSKGSDPFKEALLKKCLSRLSVASADRISDEELEYVAAAGTGNNETGCPFPGRPCGSCTHYLPGQPEMCGLGCRKPEDGSDG
ncbi:MAG TPA: hypothetical protein VHR42_04515 [Clostridia bacterium]|nr:hypothetical protein [Clostridia bacterium]